MPDVRLHLTPTTLIRGAAAPAQSAQPDGPPDPDALFSIYDFLDLAARPPSRDEPPNKTRGPFSRNVWARLTYTPPGQPKSALASLVSLAPIRANATRNRMTVMPVMTVAGLLELLAYVMRDAASRATVSDHYRHHAMSIQRTLENFQHGDRSMLETLTEPAPEIDAPETAVDELPARPTKKRKTVSAVTDITATDVTLRLTHDNTIFGIVHPVHEHVFSAYAFIDLIYRQLHPASNCVHFARRFWASDISKHPDIRNCAVMAPIRCSASFAKKTNTPAVHAKGLIVIIRLILNKSTEYKGKWKNKRYIPVDRNTVGPIGAMLDAYIAGDRSMIEINTLVQ
jgi:hypothetical protein